MEDLLSQAESSPLSLDWALTLEERGKKISSGFYDLIVIKNPLQEKPVLQSIAGLMKKAPSSGFIVCSEAGSSKEAGQLIVDGVHEYLTYPLSISDLVSAVTQILENLRRSHGETSGKVAEANWSEVFIGDSPQIKHCLEVAIKAAAMDVSVLITGETGTGKELLSEMIHLQSARSAGKFIIVDCAALPEHLVESTLYGHERGAFTSAERSRKGLVQEAHRGTLFLDEVGELPLDQQRRFLRVLDTGTFRKVGGDAELYSDFRLIAATHRDLDKMVTHEKFREDLLHRIRTMEIRMPALRDRPDDIEALAQRHLEEFCRETEQPVKKMSSGFLSHLMNYEWPGNIRELFNTLERSVAAAGEEHLLQKIHLPVSVRASAARRVADSMNSGLGRGKETSDSGHASSFPTLADFRQKAIHQAEKEYLQNLIDHSRGSIETAVTLSGLSRSRLYALLKEHGLTLKK
jgi:two-component system NtrC family response regulator